MTTTEQTTNKINYANKMLEAELKTNLNDLESSLQVLKEGNLTSKTKLEFEELVGIHNINYVKISQNFFEKYGLEFPEIKKEYELMLQKINKYLGVK